MSKSEKKLKNKDKPYSFISYSHNDKRKVDSIITQLQQEGALIWFDDHIRKGKDWATEIAEWLKHENCINFILFISSESVKSDYIRDEINMAKKYKKNIIVVYLNPVELPADLELLLARFEPIEWYGRSKTLFMKELIESLKIPEEKDGREEEPIELPKIPEEKDSREEKGKIFRLKDFVLLGLILFDSVLTGIFILLFVGIWLKPEINPQIVTDNKYLERFSIENDTYHLGCRIQEFYENGWELYDNVNLTRNQNELLLGASSMEEIRLKRNDSIIKVSILNMEDEEISYRYCYVTGIEVGTYDCPVNSFQIGNTEVLDSTIDEFADSSRMMINSDGESGATYSEYYEDDKIPMASLKMLTLDDKITFAMLNISIRGKDLRKSIGEKIDSYCINDEEYTDKSKLGDYLRNGWSVWCVDNNSVVENEPHYFVGQSNQQLGNSCVPLRLHKKNQALLISVKKNNIKQKRTIEDAELSYITIEDKANIEYVLINNIDSFSITKNEIMQECKDIDYGRESDTFNYQLNDSEEIDFSYRKGSKLPSAIKIVMDMNTKDSVNG